jgi:hypothetical protein
MTVSPCVKLVVTPFLKANHPQHLAPNASHAHVHTANVRQEADLALGVTPYQCNGNGVALLALKRIDRAHAGPALQQQIIQHGAVFNGVFQTNTEGDKPASAKQAAKATPQKAAAKTVADTS